MRRLLTVMALITAPVVLAIPVRAQEQPDRISISALDNVFAPAIARVAVGGTVEWSNEGGSRHTVDADDGTWSSGNLEPSATFTRTFDEAGAFPFFCRYHGAPGAGMAGTVVVGDATLPGGAAPGPDPVPGGPSDTFRVPEDAPTIQEAIDRAQPGGLVLVAPGEYHEAVVVTTPYLTIRGMDRNETILDGNFELGNGITVVEADGVAIENLTARHYVANGFYWSNVLGFRGSYLTASSNGDYGIYAYGSRWGRLEHSYASGSPDAGFYIGACQPCDTVIVDVVAEHNALGYSGTNAGGSLAIVNSEWRENLAGIVPNTDDAQPYAPQTGIVIAGNHVHHNGSTTVDAKELASVPYGMGIVVAGGRDNEVVGNLVEDQATYGIATIPIVDERFWPSGGNEIRDNVVRRSGLADLAIAAPAAGGDCFEDNDAGSSHPAAIELLFPCEGPQPFPGGGGSMAPTANVLARFVDQLDGDFARGDWREQPAPPDDLSDMPDDPVTAPPNPAIPGEAVPGIYRIRSVETIRPAGGPEVGPAVSVMGIPLLATSWWSLLLGLYGYVLPFVLYASWVAISLWDLIRRDADSIPHRARWMAVVLLVPFVGPLLYFGFGGSEIPAPLRLMLTAGGVAAYLVFLVLGFAFGG
ncbi:MAG TPA: right-handed parallel beta-helix repeat-containing protein [Actinomycetota bacterium]|nr:right-handed parallel beta-helix repeat-containing protein [Actinomycetota bacterium]